MQLDGGSSLASKVRKRKDQAHKTVGLSMAKGHTNTNWQSTGGGVAYQAPSNVIAKVRRHAATQHYSAPTVQHEPTGAGTYAARPTAVSSYRQAPTPEFQARTGQSGGNALNEFLDAIVGQESGGNYGAIGVPTRSGTAVGKYQILDTNFAGPGGWDAEALGKDITVPEYIGNPAYQEQIARAKLTQYFREYGPVGAAKAWYGGPGNANTNSNSPQYGGPSLNNYAASVLARMQHH